MVAAAAIERDGLARRRAMERMMDGRDLDFRLEYHRRRVEQEQRDLCLHPELDETRGTPRPVIRDDFDQWESVAKAARAVGVKPDWICQAIRRRGTCGRHRWAYIDDIPDGFFLYADGTYSPWPYRYGNPIIVPVVTPATPEGEFHGGG